MKDIDIENAVIAPAALAKIPAGVAYVYKVVPISFEGDVLTVALGDPWNLKTLEDLSRMFGCQVKGMAADDEAVLRVLQKLYGGPGKSVDDLFFEIDHGGEDPASPSPA